MDAAIAAARAFDNGPWPQMSAGERADAMQRLLDLINANANELAELITAEIGSPILFSHFGQVGAASMVLDYYVNLTRTFEFESVRPGMLGPVLVRKEGVGVCAGIVPWNVPLFIIMLKLAPALASGSTIVLKPAPESPLSGMYLAKLIDEAGFPPGVVNIVPAGREAGEHLVTAPGVDKVSFTGSTAAGKKIGALCGERLRRCTLELGGKSAAILLDDVDIAATVPALLPYGIMNNGQACVAQTRILAPRSRYDEVVDAFTEAMGNLKTGDPAEMDTDIGPLIAERQRDRVESYIAKGLAEGARITVGGGRPEGLDGWFVEPTLFVDVDNSMTIAQEEIFGPVLAVIPYDDVDDAVAIANDSDFGLSGSVWTTDVDAGVDIARGSAPAPIRSTGSPWSGAPRSAATRTPASAASSAPRACPPTSRTSRSTCRPASSPRCAASPRRDVSKRVARLAVRRSPRGAFHVLPETVAMNGSANNRDAFGR